MFNPIRFEYDDAGEYTCDLCGDSLTLQEIKVNKNEPAFAFSGKRFLCSYCRRNINLSIILE